MTYLCSQCIPVKKSEYKQEALMAENQGSFQPGGSKGGTVMLPGETAAKEGSCWDLVLCKVRAAPPRQQLRTLSRSC